MYACCRSGFTSRSEALTYSDRGVKPLLQPGAVNAKTHHRVGFTLVELLMAIAIIAIIGGFVLGVGQSSSQAALSAQAAAELTTLSAALEAYRIVHGDYPRTADPAVLLQALIGKLGPTGAVIERRSMIDVAHLSVSGNLDPFTTVTAKVVDPWARPYHYAYKSSVPWAQPGYVLFSGGPDQLHAPLLSSGSMDGEAPENLDNIYLEQ